MLNEQLSNTVKSIIDELALIHSDAAETMRNFLGALILNQNDTTLEEIYKTTIQAIKKVKVSDKAISQKLFVSSKKYESKLTALKDAAEEANNNNNNNNNNDDNDDDSSENSYFEYKQ